ncbi:hypothetical protein TNIN_371701 [Trichonephila inaurata madagascariensis]|uniref:Uncharacterized protein n=1 Tax=Trichonephila inaurata madagascariensis TaxID=2747483 RepID=A0A8X7C514_9ARAC|nr:hypothetical protein TNIN_371701 [Trichonephila inaurata madagascariensis]
MSPNPTSFPVPLPGNRTASPPAGQITYVEMQIMVKQCYKNDPSRSLESSTLINFFFFNNDFNPADIFMNNTVTFFFTLSDNLH